jgi:hypothetical protein
MSDGVEQLAKRDVAQSNPAEVRGHAGRVTSAKRPVMALASGAGDRSSL